MIEKLRGKLRVKSMGKYKPWLGVLFSLMVPACFASDARAVAENSEDSFAQLEALDQHVEQTNKQIDALKVTQQLRELQEKANRLTLDFVVIRIMGINYNLTASLQFTNKNIITVSKGDVIEERFRVTSITANAVYVYDIVSKVTRIVPFA